jgi:multidrug efflux pump subunit AcrB
MTRLQTLYERLLRQWLKRSQLLAVLLTIGLIGTAAGLATIPTAFIPNEDQGQLRGYFTLPEGASLERTVKVMDQIEPSLPKIPSSEPEIFTQEIHLDKAAKTVAPSICV